MKTLRHIAASLALLAASAANSAGLHLPQRHAAAHRADSLVFAVEAPVALAGLTEAEDEGVEQGVKRLTEADYEQAARELGIDVPAIKAVVEIEAGRQHHGFHAPGEPIINFDLTMFRRYASKRGVDLAKYAKSHSAVFSRGKNTGQKGAWTRFRAAESINRRAAIEGTFWGMFQIGGFNYKLVGADSPEQMAEMMSRSEHDQLEMFVRFVINTGMDKYLKNKDWAGFAKRYNGPGYAKRGYHTRMAAAYAKHKKGG